MCTYAYSNGIVVAIMLPLDLAQRTAPPSAAVIFTKRRSFSLAATKGTLRLTDQGTVRLDDVGGNKIFEAKPSALIVQSKLALLTITVQSPVGEETYDIRFGNPDRVDMSLVPTINDEQSTWVAILSEHGATAKPVKNPTKVIVGFAFGMMLIALTMAIIYYIKSS